MLYAEVDGAPGRTAGDLRIHSMAPGLGPAPDKPKAYPSTELRGAISASTAFDGGPPPVWLASEVETAAFWALRDGAVQVGAAHDHLPELLVMHVSTEKDHVQTQIDYPHARSHVQAWLDAGHAWVRLNPDAAYVSDLSGVDAALLPDNDANTTVPWPGTIDAMSPETVDGTKLDPHMGTAAHLELADRVQAEDTRVNLDATLSP